MYGKKIVSKDNILALINSYDIFKKYIVGFVDVGKAFKSELRADKSPTCVVFKGNTDLLYKDYAVTGALSCFGYVMQKYSCNYFQALDIVSRDFNLDLVSTVSEFEYTPTASIIYNVDISKIESTPADIRIKVRNWNLYDKEFWNDQYELTISELKEGKVFPLEGFWLNNSYFKAHSTAYGYYFGFKDGRELWKIYQPYSKKAKFFTNTGPDDYQGFDLLPETEERLIITKSYKDVLVLRKLGIPAIAPQSESSVIDKDFYDYLLTRFKEIRLLFDNDEPGIKAANKLQELIGIQHFILPQDTKDCADFVKKYNYTKLLEYINQCWEVTK